MVAFASLDAGGDDIDAGDSQWAGESRVRGPKWLRLPLLTMSMLGLQFVWSVEMGYASPYLLRLGLSKSLMAIVFVAGPLSGLVVQPLIGALADRTKSRFGRRRPYMLIGCLICIFALLLLGFTREFASLVTRRGSSANDTLTVWLAILSIYCIDFSINAVQAVDRALVVDVLPIEQQADGNAWAGRMLGFGTVFGFFVGNVDLTRGLYIFGRNQLEILVVIASLVFLLTHILTAASVQEKVLIVTSRSRKSGLLGSFKEIWSNLYTLPYTIRQICLVQFFAWIGWFPILFYTSVYVGELYKRGATDTEDLEAAADRAGSRALLYNGLLALFVSIVAPPAIARFRDRIHLAEAWAVSQLIFALCMLATFFVSSANGAIAVITTTGFSWAFTQWAPFALLGEAIRSDNPKARHAEHQIPLYNRPDTDEEQALVRKSASDDSEGESDSEDDAPKPNSAQASSGLLGNSLARQSSLDVATVASSSSSRGIADKAGIILGIHNLALVAPQFLVTGLASIVFAVLEPPKSDVIPPPLSGNGTSSDAALHTALNATRLAGSLVLRAEGAAPARHPNALAIVFRIGGFSSFISAIVCWRLARHLKGL